MSSRMGSFDYLFRVAEKIEEDYGRKNREGVS